MFNSHYKGTKKFDREQLIFATEVILIGALDRIESQLPTTITEDDLDVYKGSLTWYGHGALEAAGMSLGVLYAQLTDDGLGIYDALHCAGRFYETCKNLAEEAWKDNGKAIYQAIEARRDTSFSVTDVLPKYPNTREHAEAFVDSVFKEYLMLKAR